MKKIILGFLWISLTSLGAVPLLSQTGPVSTGGDASNPTGAVSFSIGQVFFVSTTGMEGNINPGLQQPFEIFEVSGVDDLDIQLIARVFPNPTPGVVVLVVENPDLKQVYYNLVDLQGRLLVSNRITDKETTLKMEHLSDGTYFLHVYDPDRILKTFKLIKAH